MNVKEILNDSRKQIMEIENRTLVSVALCIKEHEIEEWLIDKCVICLGISEYKILVCDDNSVIYMCYICKHTFDNLQKITKK